MTRSALFEANQSSTLQKEHPSSFLYPEPLLDESIKSKHFLWFFFLLFISYFFRIFGSNFFSSKVLPFRKGICKTEETPLGL